MLLPSRGAFAGVAGAALLTCALAEGAVVIEEEPAPPQAVSSSAPMTYTRNGERRVNAFPYLDTERRTAILPKGRKGRNGSARVTILQGIR
jgi:hypothetical protein